jgi:hypothetical protein
MKFAVITISAVLFVLVCFILIVSKDHQRSTTNQQTHSNSIPSILSYENTNSSVAFTIFGNLVADSQRTAVKIAVTASNVNISVLNGYDETVVNSENFSNNLTAYNAFLENLNANDYLTSKSTSLKEASACPSGETYQMDLYNNSVQVSSLWDDNCNPGVDGTFKGNGQQNVFAIETLFQNQIPNYSDFTSNYTF